MFLHILENQLNGLSNIGKSFLDGMALGITAGKRRASHDVAVVFVVSFQENLEIDRGHP